MDHVTALKLVALLAVVEPDTKATLRQIFRWYSTTFATPLHTVEELPLDYVLQQYYEGTYEKLEKQELEDTIKQLTSTKEELEAEQQAEEEAERVLRETMEEMRKENAPKSLKQEDALAKTAQPLQPAALRESELPVAVPVAAPSEPVLSMKFSESDMDDMQGIAMPEKRL